MKIRLELFFKVGVLNSADYIYFFQHLVKFTPTQLSADKKPTAWDLRKSDKLIESNAEKDFVFIRDDDANFFSFSVIDICEVPFMSIAVKEPLKMYNLNDEDINEFAAHPGFTSAYLLNHYYEVVQSTVFSNNLEGRGISKEILDTIKNTPAKDGMFGGKEYDIRFNPGRSIIISQTSLMVGWKMWFNGDFFNVVSKERILSFPYAIEIKELDSGGVW